MAVITIRQAHERLQNAQFVRSPRRENTATMELFSVLNIVCAIITGIYVFLRLRVHYWKMRNVPFIHPELFYGNSRGINKDYHTSEFMRRMYLQLKPLGPIGGAFMFIRTVAIVTDLELVKDIMVKNFAVFPNRGSYSNEKDDFLSAHLVSLEDDDWRQLRHKLTPTFTSGKLKAMFETITEVTDRLVATIEKESKETGQLEVKGILSRFTTDVIGSTAFGLECNCLEDKNTKFYEIGLKAFASFNFFKRMFVTSFRDLSRKLHITTTRKEIGDFYVDVVRSTMKYRDDNPQVKRNDFMNLLMKLRDSGELTFEQIAAQSMVFFLAG